MIQTRHSRGCWLNVFSISNLQQGLANFSYIVNSLSLVSILLKHSGLSHQHEAKVKVLPPALGNIVPSRNSGAQQLDTMKQLVT